MKPLALIAVLVLSGCSAKRNEGFQSGDSLTSNTSDPKAAHMPPVIDPVQQIEDRLADLDQFFQESAEDFYVINLEANGYEYMSSGTWFIDSTLTLRYYETTWAQEGMEGKGHYYFLDGELDCISEEETAGGAYSTTIQACHDTGGMRFEWPESAEEATKEPLPADYLVVKYDEIISYYNNLLKLLKDNDPRVDDDEVHYRIENPVDVGEEFVETTEIVLPKALYDKLG